MAKPDLWSVRSLAATALAAGGERVSLTRVRWDVAGRCEAPRPVIRFARPARERDGSVTVARGKPHPMEVELMTPCRKCSRCLAMRAAHWRHRAVSEIQASPRAWFCTWTLSPEARFRTLSMARAALSAQSVEYESIPPAEQFGAWCKQIGREFTLGLKRLRKNTRSPVRYVIIAEGHKDGTPHFHGLIHEVSPLHPVTHKALVRDVWRLGFARYKLADAATGGYVTKYLTKSSLVRVRASRGYGDGLSRNSPEWESVNPRPLAQPLSASAADATRPAAKDIADEVPF